MTAPEAARSARSRLFHATDLYGGLVSPETRSATLDGSVPLRAAQSCPPFLAGNAAGIVLTLTRGIRVERRFGRIHADLEDEDGDLARRHAAALPALVSRGLLTRRRAESLRPLRVSGSSVFLFTGLLLAPEPGLALHLTHAGNRRSTFFRVAPLTVVREEHGTPLVLELVLEKDAPSRFRIAGEIATLLPLRSGSSVDLVEVEAQPGLAARHAAFYDAAYFDTKRDDPTGKYRRLKPPDPQPGGSAPVLTVARAGPGGNPPQPR
ncbi:MAG: hypothetical protein JNK60_03595, partial [Acidobacteria bacterium]|nr:hypothetical protein [Acidobacteriota bacterium]